MVLMEDDDGPCKFVLIFQGGSSKLLEFKLSQFNRLFMEKFEDVFKNWTGNVSIFNDADDMVSKTFTA